MPFRLEATDDQVFDWRLVLDGPLPGWLVLEVTAPALAPPRRPVLRIERGSEPPQDRVCPGPCLGRAFWVGLIPGDATGLLLSLGPDMRLERVGRRGLTGLITECVLRRPAHAVASLYERITGQARRSLDTLRAGVVVAPLRRFPQWTQPRTIPFDGEAPPLSIACAILAAPGEGRAVARTLDSLARQSHAPADIAIYGEQALQGAGRHLRWDRAAAPSVLLSGKDALCVLKAGDELAPGALSLLAAGIGDADLAYSDEIGHDGRPRLKPDWSPDLALAAGVTGRPALMSRGLLARLPAGGLGPLAEAGATLDMAVALAARHATHVARPLARTAGPWPLGDRREVLAACLAAARSPAHAVERNGATDLLWPLPDPAPRVSIVIPSRDRPDLIRTACRGILRDTNYPAIELVVVDNGSTDGEVLAFYDELRDDRRVRILDYSHPFNFAAMVNAGVEASSGEVVVLLNNDVAVRDGGWLGEMVRQAVRPEVGAVGAKLLFGDGTLQHAGVVVGLGGRAGHILRRRPAETPGHLGQLRVAHEVSAVTAACLAVSAAKYRAVGGFDAQAFPVDFNDVDFCLRLAARGWKSIWTPASTLFHLESISRGPSVGAKRVRFEEEAARFTERWGAVIRHDPYYHPALSLTTFGEGLE